jgi:hypothetical protein
MKLRNIGSGLAAVALAAAPALAQEASNTASEAVEPNDELSDLGRVTEAQCFAMEVENNVIACLTKLNEQLEAENAARTERVEVKADEAAALNSTEAQVNSEEQRLAAEEAQVNTTTEGLRKDIENIFIAEATPSE